MRMPDYNILACYMFPVHAVLMKEKCPIKTKFISAF